MFIASVRCVKCACAVYYYVLRMRICMMSSGVVIMSSEKGFRSAAGKPRRFYVRHSRLSFGEDRTHEFKGHRSLACEEVPRRLMHSRKSVSRSARDADLP